MAKIDAKYDVQHPWEGRPRKCGLGKAQADLLAAALSIAEGAAFFTRDPCSGRGAIYRDGATLPGDGDGANIRLVALTEEDLVATDRAFALMAEAFYCLRWKPDASIEEKHNLARLMSDQMGKCGRNINGLRMEPAQASHATQKEADEDV